MTVGINGFLLSHCGSHRGFGEWLDLRILGFRIFAFQILQILYRVLLYNNSLMVFLNLIIFYMFEDQQEVQQDFVIPPHKTLDLTIQPETKLTCQTLCIAFYGVSSLYASTLVDTKQAVARINFQKAKQKSLASVYLNSDKTTAHIIFNEQFQKMKEIHLAKFVTKYFQFKSLVIFTCVPRGILEVDDGVKLKYLQTSLALDLHGPKYPQGISGPEADLLQWAQINGINATCFVGIFSEYQLNRQIIDGIFGNISNMLPFESTYDISKQIKAYNTLKYSSKLYL